MISKNMFDTVSAGKKIRASKLFCQTLEFYGLNYG